MSDNHELQFSRFTSSEKNITNMVNNRIQKYGDKVALRDKARGYWKSLTWNELGDTVAAASKALLELGVKEGETVGLFSQNRAEWTISDLAILGIGAVTVPVYATNSKHEAGYIVNEARIRIIFVNDQDQYNTALAILKEGGALSKIIVFDESVVLHGKDGLYFSDFLASGRESSLGDEARHRLEKVGSEDLATVIYTAGTAVNPRGVMLTHGNFLYMFYACRLVIDNDENDVALSYLSLSHVFERCMQYVALCGGSEYNYCHDTKLFVDFLKEVRPDWVCAVPGVWEKIHSSIFDEIDRASFIKKALFVRAREIGEPDYLRKFRDQPVPLNLRIKHFFAYHLIIKKINALFGGRCRFVLNGGAPFNADINRFFVSMGVPASLGYGLTEMFPVSVPMKKNFKYGTSGALLPMVEFRLSVEDEIQVRGPNLMKGYYKNPEATREVITSDGWLKTGDVGHLDSDGDLVITDRIKEIIVISGGRYISPARIETVLKMNFFVEQAVALGEKRKFITALIVPSFPALEEFARKNSIVYSTREELIAHREVVRLYGDIIEKQCADLRPIKRIRKFTLLSEELSQENGELTPTGKLKRRVINTRYKELIEKMYQQAMQDDTSAMP